MVVGAQLLCWYNQREFERSNEEARDTSRPGFKSYGLNPGYSIRDWYIVDESTEGSQITK